MLLSTLNNQASRPHATGGLIGSCSTAPNCSVASTSASANPRSRHALTGYQYDSRSYWISLPKAVRCRSSKSEMCVIVDENNNVVGAQPRSVTVRKRLLGRGAYTLVFNSKGQLLVSKRSQLKDCYPGQLDVVISGVVTAGEEYEDTAARELEEEIGMELGAARRSLKRLFVFPYQDATCRVWGAAFSVVFNGSIRLQEEEVEWARFIDFEEVRSMMATDAQFTPVGRHILGLYCKSCYVMRD